MKKILVYLISALIAFMPAHVFASAAEKWEILENTYDQERNMVHLETRKISTSAANGKYVVDVPVSSGALGKTVKGMLKGGIAVAGIYAIVEAAGWFIDEATKQIMKIEPEEPGIPSAPIVYSFFGQLDTRKGRYYEYRYHSSPEAACNKRDLMTVVPHFETYINQGFGLAQNKTTCKIHAINYQVGIHNYPNIEYDPNIPSPQPVIVPDAEVGQAIINKPDPSIITDAYNPNNPASAEPAPAASNDALNNANPEPETQPQGETTPKPNVDTDGDGVPDTFDPNAPPAGENFELPAFCEWAPAVCDFFTVQKKDNTAIKDNQNKQLEQDKTFFEKVTDFFDWSKEDTELPAEETPSITELPTPEITEDYIAWGASCPADVQIPISLQGASSTLVFSWSPWCQLLSIIRPAIVASAYIGAAFIVLGLRT